MRRDMKDVLKDANYRHCEDDRFWERFRIKRMDEEDLPKRIPFQNRSHHVCGSQALHYFLKSKIGQLWDDVYSEICAVTDRRSHRGYALHRQLEWRVRPESECRWQGFYISEENGTLQYLDRVKYRRKIPPVTHLSLDFKPIPLNYKGDPIGDLVKWFELIDGYWYWMHRETWINRYTVRNEWLEIEDGEVVVKESVQERSSERTTTTKRQVGKRTLKKIRKALREAK